METVTEEMKRSPDERHKLTHGNLTDRFDTHEGLSQSQENKCMWTPCRGGNMWLLSKSHQERSGKKGEVEEKLNGNYLRLIPGLCLEDRMNS